MPKITPLGWLGIIILFNSTLLGGASQLGDLELSAGLVKAILAVATLANGFLGGLVTMFGSQAAQVNALPALAQTPAGQRAMVEAVENMPGVTGVTVNRKATPDLAAMALDPTHAKVTALPADQTVLTNIVKSAGVILLAVLLSIWFVPTSAYAQKLGPIGQKIIEAGAGNAAASTAATSSGIPKDILGALDDKLLPDLQYAYAIASATSSNVTAPCYKAWIDIIQARQTAVKDAQGNALALPDAHLITDFEKAVELRNALQPDSKFSIACSPVATMVKQDVLGLVSKVVAGGAGMALLGVPIIP